MTKNNSFTGNVSVTGNITAGGGVNAKGDSVFSKDLKVEGWLDAPNIRGAYKGLFKYKEDLVRKYPNPQMGWWALVGDSLPADIWMVGVEEGKDDLEWLATGNKTTGIELDSVDFKEGFDELEDKIETEISDREEACANLESLIEQKAKTFQQGIDAVSNNVLSETSLRIAKDEELAAAIDEIKSKSDSTTPVFLDSRHGKTLAGEVNTVVIKSNAVASFVESVSRGVPGYITGRAGNSLITIPVSNLHHDGANWIFSYIIGTTLFQAKVVNGITIQISSKFNLGGPIQSAPSPLFRVTPTEGEANTKTIKTTTIKFRSRIVSYDTENIKMITPNGVVFLGYGGGTYDVDGDTITINWDFEAVEGEHELRIPRGAFIVADEEIPSINIKYDVTLAPVVYFTPEITPSAGSVTAEDMQSVVIKLTDTFDSFDTNADPWYNDIYLSYMASGGYKEEKSAKFYADVTVAEDGKSITVNWSKFTFTSGTTYAMNIPKGYIVLANGDKSDATSVEYTIN